MGRLAAAEFDAAGPVFSPISAKGEIPQSNAGFSITHILKGFKSKFRAQLFGVASALILSLGSFSPVYRFLGRGHLRQDGGQSNYTFLNGDKYADSLFGFRGWSIRIGASFDHGFRGSNERA
jgi:hypothetical protein